VPPLEEQREVCIQVPLPDGVEHLALVQQRMSEDPGHKLEVTVPELQQPAEILTQTPSTPDTVQVA
jgi:hypothetical protein